MAKSQTYFKPGERKVGRTAGVKNQRTKVKEALGIASWEQLKGYVEGQGIERCVQELHKLKGRTYVYAYLTLTEYVKPKLTRVEYKDTGGQKIPFDFTSLPLELRKQILEHIRGNTNAARSAGSSGSDSGTKL